MKKSVITFLILGLLACSLFVSCNSDVSAPEALSKELVSVTFDEGSNSKSLTATLEGFDKETYYWKYAARKSLDGDNMLDGSGLRYGETTSYSVDGAKWVVDEDTPGIVGRKVQGFSQGIWDFYLYAYEKVGSNYVLKYAGETKQVTLKKGETNLATVVVSPLDVGQGTLIVDDITINPKNAGDDPSLSTVIKVSTLDGSQDFAPTSGRTWNLDKGTYKVTVEFVNNNFVYASGYVVATVYPNLTTTVSGDLDELVTYAQFDAERTPDLINKSVGSVEVTTSTGDDEVVNFTDTTTETVKVNASTTGAVAKAVLSELVPTADLSSSSLVLNLSVDTTEATTASVTYEIGLTATITNTTTSETTVSSQNVPSITDYMIIVIEGIQQDLEEVSVKHSNVAMEEKTTYADLEAASTTDTSHPGYFFYGKKTGLEAVKLYIKTKTFSPFEMTYKLPATSGVAELDGKKYMTLADAVAALTKNSTEVQTIKLLSDASGAGIFIAAADNVNVVFDLDGFTYTCTGPAVGSKGTESQAWHLEEDNTVKIKNGKVSSSADAGVIMLIQNYSNLTLEDVVADGSFIGSGNYTLSNNSGTVVLNGSTSIVSSVNGKALDSCKFGLYAITNVTINTTGTIAGIIELSGGKLEIQNGKFEGSISTVSGYQEDDAVIKGGIYNYDPTAYVADGYTVEEIEGGKFKVVEEKWVFYDLKRDSQGEIITESKNNLEYCTEIQQVWGQTKTREIERRLVRFTVASQGNISGTSDDATKFNVNCGETNLTNNPVTLNGLTGDGTNNKTIDSRLVRGDVILLPACDVVVFGYTGAPSSIQELTIVGQHDGNENYTTIHCISNPTSSYRILRIYNRGLHEGDGFGAEIVHTNFLNVNFERSDSNSSAGTALFYITDYNVQLTMKNVKVKNYKSALVSCWACGPTTENTTNGMPLKEDNAGVDIYLTNVDISQSNCTSVMEAECYPATHTGSTENWMYRALSFTTDCNFGDVPVCVNKDNHSITGQENCFVNGELVDWAVPSQQ